MKKIKKVVNIIFIILSIFMMFSFIVPKFTYAVIDPYSYNPTEKKKDEVLNKEGNEVINDVTPITNKIASVLFVIAVVVAVIGLMIMGLLFIISGVDVQAELKKRLVPVVIGIFIVGAIATIVGVLLDIGQNISS